MNQEIKSLVKGVLTTAVVAGPTLFAAHHATAYSPDNSSAGQAKVPGYELSILTPFSREIQTSWPVEQRTLEQSTSEQSQERIQKTVEPGIHFLSGITDWSSLPASVPVKRYDSASDTWALMTPDEPKLPGYAYQGYFNQETTYYVNAGSTNKVDIDVPSNGKVYITSPSATENMKLIGALTFNTFTVNDSGEYILKPDNTIKPGEVVVVEPNKGDIEYKQGAITIMLPEFPPHGGSDMPARQEVNAAALIDKSVTTGAFDVIPGTPASPVTRLVAPKAAAQVQADMYKSTGNMEIALPFNLSGKTVHIEGRAKTLSAGNAQRRIEELTITSNENLTITTPAEGSIINIVQTPDATIVTFQPKFVLDVQGVDTIQIVLPPTATLAETYNPDSDSVPSFSLNQTIATVPQGASVSGKFSMLSYDGQSAQAIVTMSPQSPGQYSKSEIAAWDNAPAFGSLLKETGDFDGNQRYVFSTDNSFGRWDNISP